MSGFRLPKIPEALKPVLILILTVLAIVLYFPFSKWLDEKMTALKAEVVLQIEQKLGRKIRYDSISPTILQFVEIKHLSILKDAAGSTPLVTFASLKIHFSIWELLTGLGSGNLVKEIEIENSTLVFDRQKDDDLFKMLEEAMQTSSSGVNTPQIGLRGTNLDLTLIDGGNRLSVRKLFFTLSDRPAEFEISLNANLEAVIDSLPLENKLVSSEIRVYGVSDRFLKNAHFDLRVSDLKTGLFQVAQQNFQANLASSQWTIRKVEDSNPIDVGVNLRPDDGELDLNLATDRFQPGTILTLAGPWAQYQPWMASELTARGSLRLHLEPFSLDYDLEGNFSKQGSNGQKELSLTGKLSGSEQKLQVAGFNVVTPESELTIDAQLRFAELFPTGHFVLQKYRLPNGQTISGTLDSVRTAGGIQIRSPRLEVGKLNLTGLTGNWIRDQSGAITFAGLTDVEIPNSDQTRGIRWFFRLIDMTRMTFQANLNLDKLPVQELAQTLLPADSLPEFLQTELPGLSLSSELTVSNAGGTLAIRGGHLSIQDDLTASRQINFQLDLEKTSLKLSDFQIRWGQVKLDGQSVIDFPPEGPLLIHNDFQMRQTNYLLDAKISLAEQRLELSGNSGLTGSLGWGGQQLVFALACQSFPLPLVDGEALLSLNVNGQASGSDFRLHLDQLKLEGSRLGPLRTYKLDTTAQIEPGKVQISSLKYIDDLSTYTGSGQAEWSNPTPDTGWEGKVNLSLVGENQKEFLKLQAQSDKGALTGTFQLGDFPLARLHQPGLKGRLTATADFSGHSDDPVIDFKLSIPDGKLGYDTWKIATTGRLSKDQFSLSNLNGLYQDIRLDKGQAKIDFRLGSANLSLPITGYLGTNSVQTNLVTEINLNEALDWSRLGQQLADRLTGRILLKDLSLNNKPSDDFIINFWQLKNNFSARGGKSNAFLARFSNNGDFKITLAAPFPVTFDLEGVLSGDRIDAELTRLKVDAAPIKDFLNIPFVSLEKGTLDGSLKIQGNTSDPSLDGTIRLKNLYVRSPFSPNPVGPFNTAVSLQDKTITLPNTAGATGKGRLEVAGVFKLDHLGLDQFNLDFNAPEPIPVYYRLTGIEATGQGQGQFRVFGNSANARLEGNFSIQDVGISLDLDSKPKASGNSDYGFGVDVNITTGQRVEFFWPKTIAPLNLRAIAAPGQKLAIKVDEKSGNFSIIGGIKIRGGEINYLNNPFFLKEGNITFNENRNRFDPKLTLKAEIRRRDASGPIIIYLKLDDFLSKITPKFDSSPPMSPDQLNNLVGTTLIIPTEYFKNSDVNSIVGLASDVGTGILLKPVVDALKRTFSLDLLSVKTDLIKQALLNNQKETTVSMEDYLDNTGIYLGKYLGDDVFLEMLGNLKSSSTGTEGTLNTKKLDFEFELGLEFQTPFFLLNWHFIPKTPEKLFITDNSLSLSWKLTF